MYHIDNIEKPKYNASVIFKLSKTNMEQNRCCKHMQNKHACRHTHKQNTGEKTHLYYLYRWNTDMQKDILKTLCLLDSPAPLLIPAAAYRLGELWTLFTGQRGNNRDALLWARPPLSGVCLFAHTHRSIHAKQTESKAHAF